MEVVYYEIGLELKKEVQDTIVGFNKKESSASFFSGQLNDVDIGKATKVVLETYQAGGITDVVYLSVGGKDVFTAKHSITD